MALMGLHYFHGAPQLGRSQGCCLMELDEWTVTWTKQVEPPQPPPRPLLTQTHTHTCIWTHRYSFTNADMHTDQYTFTSSLKENVYSCKVKHGKEETNYPADRWLGVWEAWSFFLPRFETLLLLPAADNWSPLQHCLWYCPLSRLCSCENMWETLTQDRAIIPFKTVYISKFNSARSKSQYSFDKDHRRRWRVKKKILLNNSSPP